jgi:hypothetical protein
MKEHPCSSTDLHCVAENAEKCTFEGIELANVTHEALDDFLLGRRSEAHEKLKRAETLTDQSNCLTGLSKTNIYLVIRALREEVERGWKPI